MKIGIVLSNTPTYSETFLTNQIKGLKEAGHQVILFVNKKQASKHSDIIIKSQWPINYHLIVQSLFVFIGVIYMFLYKPIITFNYFKLEFKDKKTWQMVVKNLYLNIHILSYRGLDWLHFGFSTIAINRENVALALNAKMALSFRGYDISIFPLKHPQCYDNLWKKVNKIHTISDDLIATAHKIGMPTNIPTVKITPAINIDIFKPSILLLPELSKKNLFSFLTVARLHWIKGLEYTIEALYFLHIKGIDFIYTIVGDGNEYERLSFLAYQLGISDKVRLIGKIEQASIKTLLESTDMYLQYSIHEGFCNAVLEAQAMGVLCVVSDGGGLAENVVHGQTGWVVPKRSPKILASTIEKVIALPISELNKIRHQSIERINNNFNLRKQSDAFIQFYSEAHNSDAKKQY